jgi:hypothetical protein
LDDVSGCAIVYRSLELLLIQIDIIKPKKIGENLRKNGENHSLM